MRNAGRLRWAPDGQSIALSGGFGQGVEHGLWIYSLGQDKLALVHDSFVEDMAWTADGSRIYAVAVTLDAAMDWSLWSFDLLP